jgi:hypothetical protein
MSVEVNQRYLLQIFWKGTNSSVELHGEWYDNEKSAVDKAKRYAQDGHRVDIWHTCDISHNVHRRFIVHPAEIRVESCN